MLALALGMGANFFGYNLAIFKTFNNHYFFDQFYFKIPYQYCIIGNMNTAYSFGCLFGILCISKIYQTYGRLFTI